MTARGARPSRVAYQGGPGAYGEAAARLHAGAAARALPRRTFADVIAAVVAGDADLGVLPVWNSTIGPVRPACDALEAAGASVERVTEVTVPVRHAVLALPGATLGSVRAVGSHPAALAQCGRFFAAHPGLRQVEAWDTAGTAAELAALGRGEPPPAPWFASVADVAPIELAAVASAAAAGPLGLVVVAAAVQDDPDNATRFAVVRAREGRP